jgi:hypothetical protein
VIEPEMTSCPCGGGTMCCDGRGGVRTVRLLIPIQIYSDPRIGSFRPTFQPQKNTDIGQAVVAARALLAQSRLTCNGASAPLTFDRDLSSFNAANI